MNRIFPHLQLVAFFLFDRKRVLWEKWIENTLFHRIVAGLIDPGIHCCKPHWGSDNPRGVHRLMNPAEWIREQGAVRLHLGNVGSNV